jgi:hypothetical protein
MEEHVRAQQGKQEQRGQRVCKQQAGDQSRAITQRAVSREQRVESRSQSREFAESKRQQAEIRD